jgi:MFS family permease
VEKTDNTRNLHTIVAKSVLSGFSSSMTRTVWQPFVLSLGAPMSTLGMLESLGGMRGLLPAPLQYIGGWLSDRLGRKPFIAVGNLSGLLAVCLVVLAGTTQVWWWLLPAVILLGSIQIADPPQQSLIAESTPIGQRGMAYSILIVAWIAPGIFAPTFGGFVAERWGFVPVFLIEIVLYAAGLLLILRFLRESLRAANHGRVSLEKLKGALLGMVVPPRNLRGFYFSMAMDTFAWGMGSALLYGMLTETYGFTTLQLGIMSSAQSIAWAFSQLPIGKLIDRHGCKPLIVLSESMGIPIVAGWLFSTSFPAFAVLHAFFGLMAATWIPAQTALLANSVPEHQRGEAMGRLAVFRGLLGFPAPFIGGMLYDHFGFRAPMLANLVGVFVCIALLILTVKEPPRGTDAL